jgi:hypothetical protein
MRRAGVSRPGTGWIAAALVIAWAIAACTSGTGGPSVAPATSASSAATPSSTTAPPPSPSPQAPSAAPSASAAASPSGAAVLNPERCPPTLPPPDTTTADGIALEGDAKFVKQVEDALDLLDRKASASYADVVANVTRVRQVDSFSGMCYDSGTYRVGDETAYAPGHPRASQVIWLAGTIVHDGCHRARYAQGLDPAGKEAEVECLQRQAEALKGIDDTKTFLNYVRGLIAGADDPDNQYWNNPNRHW